MILLVSGEPLGVNGLKSGLQSLVCSKCRDHCCQHMETVADTTQKRIRRTIQCFCDNSFNIKLVFSSFKIGSLFSVKDLIPKELKSCVVYRFSCAGCGACYVGETS